MSEEKHEFHVRSEWANNSDGDGIIALDWGGTWEYGVPTFSGGKAGRANPEELLISAVISCYSITLALLMEKRKMLPPPRIEVDADGTMIRNPDRTLKFTTITLKAKIYAAHLGEAEQQKILDLAQKAEHLCPISNAVRGNVEVTVDAEIV